MPAHRLQSCDTLAGSPLVDASGRTLGTVDELLVDLDSGRICFAIASRDGQIGATGRLSVLPFSWLSYDERGQRFVLLAADALERAPGFEDHQRPDLADRRWQATLSRQAAVPVSAPPPRSH